MAQPSSYHVHDRLLDGRLGPMLVEWRKAKVSAEDISFTLRSDHGIKVSAATVLRWAAIAEREALEAAS